MLQHKVCARKKKLRSWTAWTEQKETVRIRQPVKRKAEGKEILRCTGNTVQKVFRQGGEARQLVTHGHFTINGKKANIPSMEVKAGDVIAVKAKSQSSPKFKEIKEMSITVPAWMTVDVDKLEGKVVALPRREEIDTPIAEHLIVELYSK